MKEFSGSAAFVVVPGLWVRRVGGLAVDSLAVTIF